MNIIKQIEEGKIEQWLHPNQKTGHIEGNKLYKYLKDNDMIKDCLSLEDLEEIQKQGGDWFRKYIGNNFYYGWKSVRDRNGRLRVPFLCEGGDEVVLYWGWLGSSWRSGSPALRHASTQNSVLNSNAQSLSLAIEAVRKAGHIVILKKNWYITGQGHVMEMGDSNKSKGRKAFLGSYESKEKAEQVRDEIKNKYGNNN